jgi:uncharacterized SAM-binding protein YcdF (DUF218 family)
VIEQASVLGCTLHGDRGIIMSTDDVQAGVRSPLQTEKSALAIDTMTTTERPRAPRFLVWALVLAVLAAAGLLLTLVWFVAPSTQEVDTVPPADAVVLFAGATERLDTAVELMENGAAPSLVIPNGTDIEVAEDLCEGEASFEVICPVTDEVTTTGEARSIGRIAGERGWSSLIAVTSVYHVHRATFLLGRCYVGSVDVVTPSQDLGVSDWVDRIPSEWAGFLAAVVLQPAC